MGDINVVGVLGQRSASARAPDYDNYEHIKKVLVLYARGATKLIHGGQPGPQLLAARWAEENNIPHYKVRPNIAREINMLTGDLREDTAQKQSAMDRAFDERDREIITLSNYVIIFWNGVVPRVPTYISAAIRERKYVIVQPLV